ncbi:hypothetical protein K523DRAFT_137088 [Schizophyllum commune Tattone D]|nr:hypothetical protein K523DRAFT_137088 [Schizophyllum commune Tattone D]
MLEHDGLITKPLMCTPVPHIDARQMNSRCAWLDESVARTRLPRSPFHPSFRIPSSSTRSPSPSCSPSCFVLTPRHCSGYSSRRGRRPSSRAGRPLSHVRLPPSHVGRPCYALTHHLRAFRPLRTSLDATSPTSLEILLTLDSQRSRNEHLSLP